MYQKTDRKWWFYTERKEIKRSQILETEVMWPSWWGINRKLDLRNDVMEVLVSRDESEERSQTRKKKEEEDQEDRTEIKIRSNYLWCVRIEFWSILNISVDNLMEEFDQRSWLPMRNLLSRKAKSRLLEIHEKLVVMTIMMIELRRRLMNTTVIFDVASAVIHDNIGSSNEVGSISRSSGSSVLATWSRLLVLCLGVIARLLQIVTHDSVSNRRRQ